MTKETLNEKNTAFFSSADDSYIFQAATSLLSIRQFLPDAKLYILSRHISDKNKKYLKKHSIEYLELDLTYLFFQIWQYPIECYYTFAGPELFKKLGFKYSVYLDGDVLCLKNPLENCPIIHDIGGVQANSFGELFGPDKDNLVEEFEIPHKLFSKHRINSGVVYMNNITLSKINFLQKGADLYYRAWCKKCPQKSNDSLFALFQIVYQTDLSPIFLDDEYNYTPHYKGFAPDDSIIIFHFSIDKPWKTHPYQHNNKKQNICNNYVKIWRKIGRKSSLSKWFNTLSLPTAFTKYRKRFKEIVRQIYFTAKGVRYPILKKRKNVAKWPISLYWWETPSIKNFGDTVSQDIIYNILGFNTIWEPIETCRLIAAGSIVEIAKEAYREEPLSSWGSGFIDEINNRSGLGHIKFYAIRGQNSLSKIGYTVPTGDPGILINSAYLLRKKRHSKKIGVVIHYADFKTEIAKKICEDPRFEVITPLDSSKHVANKISECGLILSSSLHGLIFADSLSIPNAHIKISDNLTGGIYKFTDYYSGVGKEYRPANIKKIFDDDYLDQLKSTYQPIPKLAKKQRTLIKSFPFN